MLDWKRIKICTAADLVPGSLVDCKLDSMYSMVIRKEEHWDNPGFYIMTFLSPDGRARSMYATGKHSFYLLCADPDP